MGSVTGGDGGIMWCGACGMWLVYFTCFYHGLIKDDILVNHLRLSRPNQTRLFTSNFKNYKQTRVTSETENKKNRVKTEE